MFIFVTRKLLKRAVKLEAQFKEHMLRNLTGEPSVSLLSLSASALELVSTPREDFESFTQKVKAATPYIT